MFFFCSMKWVKLAHIRLFLLTVDFFVNRENKYKGHYVSISCYFVGLLRFLNVRSLQRILPLKQ
jgi:hypothetical protein